MKKVMNNNSALTERVIARFGEAHLIRHFNGKFELRGGSPHERGEAREWTSLFFHEAVLPTRNWN